MTKSLLLKGLAGVAAVGGAGAGLFVFREDIFGGGGNKSEKAAEIKKEENKFTHKELIDKVGLNCGLTDGEEVTDSPKECSIKENGTISIKVGEQIEEGVTFNSTSGSAKLKVSRSKEVGGNEGTEIYNNKLKFVVDSGDIALTKKEGGITATTIQKLEQFETYEIKEVEGKFYLSRRTDAKVGIKNALGLGEFSLPDAGGSDTSNSYRDAEQIKKIRFEGHEGGISVTGEIGLKVSSTVDTTTFPYGYRFNFTFPSEVTINGKKLKAKIPYEFKIKKGTENTLSLEKAWADDNTFTKKAGLDCSGDNKECTVSTTEPKLNVKVGNQKKEGISSLNTGTGKIKMETEQQGYNQGLKFSITSGDVTLGEGGTGDAITKLEELETYEITEDGGKYYLTKKTSPDELIKKTLVLPQGCELPTNASVDCTLSEDAFKAIKFEGKDTDKPTGTATLTISKANSTDFPFGYKFTFKTTSETTIKASTTIIKAKIPTDFKIKKVSGSGQSTTLSLEKAWSDFSLAEKVGLKCSGSTGSECCTMNSAGTSGAKLNVKKGTDKKEDITSINTSPGKIKVEKDKEGYNQGLKFTISEGDVSLTGGDKTSGTDFTTLEEFETYEITDEGGKYYLTRKDEASKTIESQLGLKEAGCSLSGTSSSCSNLTSEKLQKINFNEKESGKPTISSGTATLTITKTDKKEDFPLGYKFTLQSEKEITIKTDNKVAAKIPTDFKIKKATNGGSLTLEKAWTMDSLGKKVGLSCTTGSNECTIDNASGGQLKVKQMSEDDEEIKQKSLTKKTSDTSNGKIKVIKDQEGYNQGFKFEISDGSIELDGSTGDDSSKITRLGEYETYEIKEEGTDWYLERKNKADVFVFKQLGLDNISTCTSLKLPTSIGGSDTCDFEKLEDLKKVNFEGKNGHVFKGNLGGRGDGKSVQLTISLEKNTTNFPLGFKFSFSGSSTNACLPTGTTGGTVKLDSSNTAGVDYKIKKTGSSLTLEKCGGNSGRNTCSK